MTMSIATKKKSSSKKKAASGPSLPEDMLRDVDKIRAAWREIVRLGRSCEHAGAKYMALLFSRLGEDKGQFRALLVGVLEEHSNSVKPHLARVDAYKVLPAAAIWKAVSWRGVSAIMRSSLTAKQRKRVVQALVSKARKHGGVIPNGALRQALAEVNIDMTSERKKSKAALERDMLVEQIRAAVNNELLPRGLLRQIFTEDALKLLNVVKRRSPEAAA